MLTVHNLWTICHLRFSVCVLTDHTGVSFLTHLGLCLLFSLPADLCGMSGLRTGGRIQNNTGLGRMYLMNGGCYASGGTFRVGRNNLY